MSTSVQGLLEIILLQPLYTSIILIRTGQPWLFDHIIQLVLQASCCSSPLVLHSLEMSFCFFFPLNILCCALGSTHCTWSSQRRWSCWTKTLWQTVLPLMSFLVLISAYSSVHLVSLWPDLISFLALLHRCDLVQHVHQTSNFKSFLCFMAGYSVCDLLYKLFVLNSFVLLALIWLS